MKIQLEDCGEAILQVELLTTTKEWRVIIEFHDAFYVWYRTHEDWSYYTRCEPHKISDSFTEYKVLFVKL